MAASTYNFAVTVGETWNPILTYQSGGSLVDLTRYTAYMQIRDGNGNILATLSTSSGITLGGAAGTISPFIHSAVTVTWTPGEAYYDLFLLDGSGNPRALVGGIVNINKRITTTFPTN